MDCDDAADLLDFDDTIDLLRQCRRGYIEVHVELSPADEERRALVATFSGVLEHPIEDRRGGGRIRVPIRLSPEHNSPRGDLTLTPTTFQRAEAVYDEDPMTLTIWQRGFKLTLYLYPSSEAEDGAPTPGPSDEDILF